VIDPRTFIPYNRALENRAVLDAERIAKAVRALS